MSARRAALCLAAVALLVGAGAAQALITVTSYPWSRATAVALEDMSTGTTQLVGPSTDDTNSAIASIGFDYWYDGVRFTTFGVNGNGFLRLGAVSTGTSFTNSIATTTNAPKIMPFWDDLCVGSNGRIHFKTIGSAPNRKLVVEFLNMQITRGAGCAGVGNGTFQLWLFETTGVIEFVFGGQPASAAADGGYSVGLQSGGATNFASVTTTGGGSVSYAAANNTQTTAIPAGNAEVFTPVVPSAPTGLNFTGTTQTSTTLNWTDNSSNEVGFAIYKSTDGGTTYTFLTQTAAGATSQADNTLSPGTTYFYQVYAVTEGALGGPASNSVTTTAAGNISSNGAGGLWSVPATWAGGVVPGAGDNVTIVDGATVTIDTAALAWTLTVGQGASGILEYEATTARSLTVGDDVTVAAGGTFQTATSGTQTGHALSVAGDLTNNGTLDFSTNTNTAGGTITFTGSANTTFGGTGGTTDIRQITMNKSGAPVPILELNTSNFTVQGVTTNVAGWLAFTNGIFKLSGTFAGTNRVFTTATYILPATGGFWLNNPNYTVVGQAGGTTCANNGTLRISQGVFGIGVGGADGMGGGAGANFIVEGGTINAVRIDPQTAVTWTQTGGVVNIGVVANTRSNFGAFELFSTASTFNMSGGTINLVQASVAATPIDYQVLSTTVLAAAGTLNVGTGATATNFNFRIRGQAPNVVVDNTTNAKTATTTAQTIINGNNTINTGSTLNLNGFLVATRGNVVNNGTITGTTAGSRFYWLDTTGTPQSYSGTGAVTAGLVSMDFDSVGGVTFNPAVSQIVTNRIIIFTGNVTNANKLTLGNGGTTTGVMQIGNTTTATAAGNLDVAPTFNAGTGGYTISYLRTTTSRTTGPEVQPARAFNTFTYDDNNATHTLTVAGGNIDVNTTLALTNGRVVTSAGNELHVGGAGTVTRTTGLVDGPFRKTFAAAGSKNFEVGTANGFSPVAFNNVAAGAFPIDITVQAVQTAAPNIMGTVITRYWALTGGGATGADLVFTYLDPTDLTTNGVNEAAMVAWRHDAAGPAGYTNQGGTINTAANTATVNGVTNFGSPGFNEWTLAEPTPTPVELLEIAVD